MGIYGFRWRSFPEIWWLCNNCIICVQVACNVCVVVGLVVVPNLTWSGNERTNRICKSGVSTTSQVALQTVFSFFIRSFYLFPWPIHVTMWVKYAMAGSAGRRTPVGWMHILSHHQWTNGRQSSSTLASKCCRTLMYNPIHPLSCKYKHNKRSHITIVYCRSWEVYFIDSDGKDAQAVPFRRESRFFCVYIYTVLYVYIYCFTELLKTVAQSMRPICISNGE